MEVMSLVIGVEREKQKLSDFEEERREWKSEMEVLESGMNLVGRISGMC